MKRSLTARVSSTTLTVLLLTASGTLGGYELVLQDGRLLEGFDLRLRDGNYYLEIESGEIVTLPADLIEEVRLNDKQLESDEKKAPTGITVDDPRALRELGQPTAPPTTGEALGVFGQKGNQFQKSTVDPYWRPEPAFDPNEDVLADSRSKWAESPIDPNWKPEPGITQADDVTNFNPSKWSQSPMDNSWVPQDGFKK